MATIHYYADPMCSWCWGFAPVIEKLREDLTGDESFEFIPGGLRPYTDTPISEVDKESILHHWSDVSELTGQPFEFEFFDDHPDFIYDTEPACRAVTSVKSLDEFRALQFHHELQRLFYAEGKDPKVLDTIIEAAERAEVDPKYVRDEFTSDDLKQRTRRQFTRARQAGVRGYPTVDYVTEETNVRLTTGYCDSETLERELADARS